MKVFVRLCVFSLVVVISTSVFAQTKVAGHRAPAKQKPSTSSACKPLLMAVDVGGYSAAFERTCTPDTVALWKISFRDLRSKDVQSSVFSGNISDNNQRAMVEGRIKNMLTEGVSETETDFMVGTLGPILNAALSLSGEEKQKKIAEADSAFLNFLSQE